MCHVSRRWLPLVVFLLVLLLPAVGHVAEPAVRPAAWATQLERPGLPNLFKVNDGLYRGAQPTAEGIEELERMGIKTIVSLRSMHSDKDILGDANITLVRIPMNAWNVRNKDVVQFLWLATDPDRLPVFVHCQHGADRTGTVCAVYRVIVDGWTKQQALDEMTNGGFGFHSIWFNLPIYIKNFDVEKIRTKVGLE